MGLKGCRLWGMGQLDSNVQEPRRVPSCPACMDRKRPRPLAGLPNILLSPPGVALQVEI
jgi:hypothetical protein